jgi:subtilisin family serine protease
MNSTPKPDRPAVPVPPSKFEVVEGPGFLYVKSEILVNTQDIPLVAAALAEFGAVRLRTDPALDRLVTRYRLPPSAPTVPEVVDTLRRLPVAREPRVGPNHVMARQAQPNVVAQPNLHGGGGGDPVPVAPVRVVKQSRAAPVRVAIVDTGVDLAALQALPLAGRFDPAAAFEPDPVYVPGAGTQIDLTGGHGTMVAGIVAQHAPNAILLSVKVLNGNGEGTEYGVAAGMLRAVAAGASVLNLSLGGYVMPGQPPTAIDAFLTQLSNVVSVVSAAGNSISNTPFYPAAHQRVVGVAALDTTVAGHPPASFTNHGPWVDACSAGVRVCSAYVNGTRTIVGGTRTFLGYAAWSGTSFATPHVAGEIANNVIATNNPMTPRQAEGTVLAKAATRPNYGAEIIPTDIVTY